MSAGLVAIGESMGLFTQSTPGPPRAGESLTFCFGGAESNVAIGVRRLGLPATWIGRVGDDPEGDLIVRELRAEGVDARVIVDAAPTGLMIRWRPTQFHSRVEYRRRHSAGAQLAVADVPDDVVAAAAVLHTTGITPALGAGPAAAVRHAIDVARAAGVPVSLDVNYRQRLWSREQARAALTPLVRDVDIVFAGPEEAAIITGSADPAQAADQLAQLGPRQVIIKLGEKGCLARIDGATFEAPAPVVTVVDTVGAGDAFVAAYLAELMLGSSPSVRLATAVRAGALAVTALGDWEGMPTRSSLLLLDAPDPVLR